MALTRKMLKAMGIEEDKIDQIIEAHGETVDALKTERDGYKADAEKLPGVQKELDALKKDGGGWEEKYNNEHTAFEKYKGEQAEKEKGAARDKAVRAYFESKGIKGANLEIAIRGSSKEIGAVELDGEKIKDTKALDDLVTNVYSGLVTKTETKGADMKKPPAGAGSGEITKEDFAKMPYRERVKLYNESPEVYKKMTE